MLAAFVLAFHYQPGGQVGDADGGVRLVHVLATGTAGAESVDPQLRFVHHHVFHFILFGQHGHGAGAGVDTALGFGGGHALHAMGAAFELQA